MNQYGVRLSVRPSVRPIYRPLQQPATGLLLFARWQEISIDSCRRTQQQRRRSTALSRKKTASAGSVMLTAEVQR